MLQTGLVSSGLLISLNGWAKSLVLHSFDDHYDGVKDVRDALFLANEATKSKRLFGSTGETYTGVSRGPQTLWPSGQRRKPEITPLDVPQASFHGRFVLLLVRQNRHNILTGRSEFFLPQGNQRSFPESSSSLLGLFLAWLHQPPRG